MPANNAILVPKEERIDYYDIFRNNEKYTRINVRLEEAQTWIDSSDMCDLPEEQKEQGEYIEKANKVLNEVYEALLTFGDDLPLLIARRYNILRAKYYTQKIGEASAYYEAYLHQSTTMCRGLEQKYGIPFTVTLIQSMIESGYGNQENAKTHHNYFNFKDENEQLVSYENQEASFIHYGETLAGNEHFAPAFAYAAKVNDTSMAANYPDEIKNESPRRFFDKVAVVFYGDEAAQYTHRFNQMAREWKFLNY